MPGCACGWVGGGRVGVEWVRGGLNGCVGACVNGCVREWVRGAGAWPTKAAKQQASRLPPRAPTAPARQARPARLEAPSAPRSAQRASKRQQKRKRKNRLRPSRLLPSCREGRPAQDARDAGVGRRHSLHGPPCCWVGIGEEEEQGSRVRAGALMQRQTAGSCSQAPRVTPTSPHRQGAQGRFPVAAARGVRLCGPTAQRPSLLATRASTGSLPECEVQPVRDLLVDFAGVQHAQAQARARAHISHVLALLRRRRSAHAWRVSWRAQRASWRASGREPAR